VLLASACAAEPANIRQASLAPTVLLLYIGGLLAVVQVLHRAGLRRAPFRISSTARGDPLRSGTLCIAEDVASVDGGGGQDLRRAMCARWDASDRFRKMLWALDAFWGGGSLAVAALVIGVAFGVENVDVGFTVGRFLSVFSAWSGNGGANARGDRLVGTVRVGSDRCADFDLVDTEGSGD
jgi:hypothetical protein